MTRGKQFFAAVLISAGLALGASGCGGDSGDATTSGGATQEASDPDRSAPFITPGGDNSVQNYGTEASDADLEQVSEMVSEYLDARADDEWQVACSHLSAGTKAPLIKVGETSDQIETADCPTVLEAMVGAVPASTRVNVMTDDGVISFRAKGDTGFVMFHGTDDEDYFLPLAREGGEWRVSTLSPTAF